MVVVDDDRLPLPQHLHDRTHLGVEDRTVFVVVTCMVVRLAVLALVAVHGAVLVCKRHDADLGVLPHPASEIVVRKDLLEHSLQHVGGRNLLAMVTRRGEDTVFRLAVEPAEPRVLDIATLARLAKHTFLEEPTAVRRVAVEKGLPIGCVIGDRLRKPDFVVLWPEPPVEPKPVGVVVGLRLPARRRLQVVGPGPGRAAVGRNRRTARADRRGLRKAELERPPRRSRHTELPVDPVLARVTQVLMQPNDIALDLLDNDVARRQLVIDRDSRESTRPQRPQRHNQDCFLHHVTPFNAAPSRVPCTSLVLCLCTPLFERL